MKLKDAIRYYELTGSDILTDLEIQSKYITALEFDYVYDDFTDVMEKLYENLLVLWADSHEVNEETEMPTKEYLTGLYLANIPKPKQEDEKEVVFERPSRFKQKEQEQENKTMNLVVSLVNSDMNIQQFFDFEIELVVDIINSVSEKREAEEKKRKSKKRRT